MKKQTIQLIQRWRRRINSLTISSIWILGLLIPGISWTAPEIGVNLIIAGLANPVAITHAGDGSGRLFITLQGGQIIIYDGTQVLPTPFLDITSLVSAGGERGLLSMAFHPNYASNGFFFVNYTDTNGDTVIARYSASANPNVADPNSALILLTITQPFGNHNGGQLQFGPDGYLYIGMGDGGSGGDPQNNAQNLASLLGKMLRIDIDSGSPFTIPPDNPFLGNSGALSEIWALGLRNPWRFSFDRLTGDLFIADVGQSSWEEVNFQPAGSPGGENYGWRLMEGSSCFNPSTNCNDGTLTLPILEYDHSIGCSITGGYRYRGTQNPGLEGIYFYGDFCTGRIWGATEGGSDGWATTELLDTGFSISTFGEDETGEIYFAHRSNGDGAIYRLAEKCSFADVPPGYWAEEAICKIYQAGITVGCSKNPLRYCPDDTVTRAQMAIFIGRGRYGKNFTPPAATGIFGDVPMSYWAADWIEQFYNDGITSGCRQTPRMYCPENPVTRAQMAVFLLRAKYGSSYTPPPATGIFADVPVTYWVADWIEQLYREGITVGCRKNPLRYCPESSVTRAMMAVFLVRTFGL